MKHMNQPRADENASTGRKREQWMISDRWIVRRLIGTLVLLLVLFIVLRNLYFPQLFVPPPQPPDMVWNFPTSIAVWGGRIYTGESETITGVFDIHSGKRVTTIPEIVVGSDAQFLYSNTGGREPGSHINFSGTLTARDSSGNLVWSYNHTPFALPSVGKVTIAAPLPNLQSDRDSVYLLGTNSQQYPEVAQLVALNKISGTERWRYTLPPYSTFVIAQGTVAVLTWGDKPQLIALSPGNGHQIWHQPISAANERLFTDGQRLFLLTSTGVRALSAQSGKQLWQFNYQPSGYGAALVFDGGVVYLLDESGAISAVSASDGRHLWHTAGKTGWSAFLTTQSGVLYVLQGSLFSAVNGSDGRTLWSVQEQWFHLPPLLLGSTDEMLYFAPCAGTCTTIFAISKQDGKLLWRTGLPIATAVLLHGQSIYLASLLESRPVVRVGFGREVAGSACSDTTTLTSLGAMTGVVEWRHATTFPCGSDIVR